MMAYLKTAIKRDYFLRMEASKVEAQVVISKRIEGKGFEHVKTVPFTSRAAMRKFVNGYKPH
jgi:hypothetical protein